MSESLILCGISSGSSVSLVFGVLGDALVLDLSDVTGVSVDFVGDDLLAAVGKDDAVRASHDLAIAGLRVAEIVVRRLILDGVREAVRGRSLQNELVSIICNI